MTDDAEATDGGLMRAADRIRETAKWLLVSFAAVGATLVAGLQLTNIGELSGHRLRWALVGVALGVVGVVIAIGAASSVVTKSFVTLYSLAENRKFRTRRESFRGDRVLLGGYPTVENLSAAYMDAIVDRRDKLRDSYRDPTDATKANVASAAGGWATVLSDVQASVLEQASFEQVRAAYTLARWGILGGAVLTAAGIAMYAWAANPPKEERVPVVSKTPTDVVVAIASGQTARFHKMLGAGCDLSDLTAVALEARGQNYTLASVPSDTCRAAVFELSPSQGRVALLPASPDTTTTK